MTSSQRLAKQIVDMYVRKLPEDTCEMEIATLLDNFRISEINSWANSKNLEAAFKKQNEQPTVKQEIPGVTHVRVWSRR